MGEEKARVRQRSEGGKPEMGTESGGRVEDARESPGGRPVRGRELEGSGSSGGRGKCADGCGVPEAVNTPAAG